MSNQQRLFVVASVAATILLLVVLVEAFGFNDAGAGVEAATRPNAHAATAAQSAAATAPDTTAPETESAATAAANDDDELAQSLLEHALEPWTGDMKGIWERGFLRVLTVYNPIYFSYDGNSQKGLIVEIGHELETYLLKAGGKKAGSFNVVIIPVSRDKLLPYLLQGRGDMVAANLTVTPERSAEVQFSDTLYPDVSELLITGPSAGTVKSLDDMVKTGIHVRKSSSYYEHLSDINAKRKAAGKPEIPVVAADENLEDFDLLELVNADVLPAVIVDSHKAKLLRQVFDKIEVHDDIAVNEGGDIAWALRKDSPELLKTLNGFVKEIKKGSLLGNILIKRYLGSTDWIENVLDGEGPNRFEATADIFKKYANDYSFDWLMVVAQGYQESRLDQSKRSHAGAIGIMQILPTTASDPNVAISGIDKAEPNVHAGIKYLRFLRDRYFDQEEVAPLDRVLFSFAAYNAGPANIAKAREKAKKMGLDPNKWFGETEVAAAKSISREPVVYVRNIYKYFVAYNQISKIQEARKEAMSSEESEKD
ncbi:MAG TPA: transporter substrate-binding domain-containing protein [Afifellaceae bacterium]|nr:transporter substrate-binding domain-containing protein [Afifellaceae bacterium]